MNFSDLAKRMLIIKKSINSEKDYRYLTSCFVQYLNEESFLSEIDSAELVIKSPDNNDTSSDAQLVRSKIWHKDECGTLWIESSTLTLQLARVNPREALDLQVGWITEKGEVIIVYNEKDHKKEMSNDTLT